MQRSDAVQRRTRRGEHTRPGPVVGPHGRTGNGGGDGGRQLPTTRRPSVRPRAADGFDAGQGPRGTPTHHHEGRARGRTGAVSRGTRRGSGGTGGVVLRGSPGGEIGRASC